jgi:hypothetical protein
MAPAPPPRRRLGALVGHLSPALCTLALSGEAPAAPARFPGVRWAQLTPAAAGVSADGLADFVGQIQTKVQVHTHSTAPQP